MGKNSCYSIPAGAVFEMLIDRKTMHAVDRRFKKKNGWSKTMLIKGLKLWIPVQIKHCLCLILKSLCFEKVISV